MPSWTMMADRTITLWTDSTLVGGLGQIQSAYVNLGQKRTLYIGRSSAGVGSVYAFEIDWSSDGSILDFTEDVIVTNSTSVSRTLAARYARFRVKNTGASAFTGHKTNVMA